MSGMPQDWVKKLIDWNRRPKFGSKDVFFRETPLYIGTPKFPTLYIAKRWKPRVANNSRNIAYLSSIHVKHMNILDSLHLLDCFNMESIDCMQNSSFK